MIRNIIGGIAVGIANIIPGVSGGTMMVILGIFNRMNEAIANLFKVHNENRKEDILFLLQVLVGAAIGLVGFAKVLNVCFEYYPTQTMYWFVGLVAFSIPVFLKTEMKETKVHWIFLVIGAAIIFGISFLSPNGNADMNPAFPALSAGYLVKMIFVGMIAGFSMFLPGISGSLILLILGEYYLFKSLVASVLTFQMNVLIPLCFVGAGILLGILLAAKLITYLLKKNARATLSLLLGLVVASTLVLIPLNASYDLMTIITSIGAFIFGGLVVKLINHFA